MSDFTVGKYFALLQILSSLGSILFYAKFRIFYLLSPLVMANLVLVSIFGLRPLVMQYPDDFSFYGLDAVSGFNQAAMFGFLATLALNFGFYISNPNEKPTMEYANKPNEKLLKKSRNISVAMMILWLILMLIIGGTSILSILAKGRSDDLNALFRGVPILLQAMPAASFMIVASSMFILLRFEKLTLLRKLEIAFLFSITAAPSALLGDRRIILPMAIVMLYVIFYNKREVKLNLFTSLIFLFVAAFLAIYPYVRSSGARQNSNLIVASLTYLHNNGIQEVFRGYLVKNDTEMFNFVSFLTPRMGKEFQYGLGRGTIIDLFREALPSSLSASHTWADMILTKMFGEGCASGLCPVPSMVGVLLYDFGLAGILFGFLLLGSACKKFIFLISNSVGIKFVVTLIFGAYCSVIVRGSSIAMIWICLNIVILTYIPIRILFKKSSIQESLGGICDNS